MIKRNKNDFFLPDMINDSLEYLKIFVFNKKCTSKIEYINLDVHKFFFRLVWLREIKVQLYL